MLTSFCLTHAHINDLVWYTFWFTMFPLFLRLPEQLPSPKLAILKLESDKNKKIKKKTILLRICDFFWVFS